MTNHSRQSHTQCKCFSSYPCSYLQKVPSNETAKVSFLPDAEGSGALLSQPIKRRTPQGSHMCRSMEFTNPTVVFIECKVHRPIQLVLNVPVLANQDRKV